jgi:hypothetical protein
MATARTSRLRSIGCKPDPGQERFEVAEAVVVDDGAHIAVWADQDPFAGTQAVGDLEVSLPVRQIAVSADAVNVQAGLGRHATASIDALRLAASAWPNPSWPGGTKTNSRHSSASSAVLWMT